MHLLDLGLVPSRQKAQQLIRAGKVSDANGQVLDKPGVEVSETLVLKVKHPPRFVSRGGEKLLEAFKIFHLKVLGKVCLDCGISTGGFTDCLLQHGAARIYGVDVGYGQTSWKLRQDSRVVLKERTNLRTLKPDDLYVASDNWATFAVVDVSFISLRLVLPAIKGLLKFGEAEAVVLVKPQFEVGREQVGKGGVVRDPFAHQMALERVLESCLKVGWYPHGIIPSPITGPAGNHEYLLWLREEENNALLEINQMVARTLS